MDNLINTLHTTCFDMVHNKRNIYIHQALNYINKHTEKKTKLFQCNKLTMKPSSNKTF